MRLVSCSILLFNVFVFSGCSTVVSKLDPEKTYKKSLYISVNDQEGDGLVIANYAIDYDIYIESPGKMDKVVFETCHREHEVNSVKTKFLGGNQYRWRYIPNEDLERDKCPMFIHVYEKKKGRHSWGFVDFRNPRYELPVNFLVNGEDVYHEGVGTAQGRAGLHQIIKFNKPVTIKTVNRCKFETSLGDVEYNFKMKAGVCPYFATEKDSGKRARFTLLGYDSLTIE